MNVEQWDIGRLKPFHNNSRVHDEKNLKAINASIDRFDWLQPIVVDKDGAIIMVAAAREADNMTQDLSFFDIDLLNENLEQIDWLDCDMTQFGFYLDGENYGGVLAEDRRAFLRAERHKTVSLQPCRCAGVPASLR